MLLVTGSGLLKVSTYENETTNILPPFFPSSPPLPSAPSPNLLFLHFCPERGRPPRDINKTQHIKLPGDGRFRLCYTIARSSLTVDSWEFPLHEVSI